jgi:anti-anti-sigma regulatory factor
LEEERFVVIRKDEAGIIRFSLIGHLNSHGISLLTRELCQLREANIRKDKTVHVVLDAEKLTLVSSGACHLLKDAIIKSGWKHRKISIQNASPEIEHIFSNDDIKALFENREHPWEPNWK